MKEREREGGRKEREKEGGKERKNLPRQDVVI